MREDSTKALVLLTTRSDYDGGEILSCSVVTVPRWFEPDADYARFILDQRGNPLYGRWYTRKGQLHGRYANAARKVWEANLRMRFGEIESELSEWQT